MPRYYPSVLACSRSHMLPSKLRSSTSNNGRCIVGSTTQRILTRVRQQVLRMDAPSREADQIPVLPCSASASASAADRSWKTNRTSCRKEAPRLRRTYPILGLVSAPSQTYIGIGIGPSKIGARNREYTTVNVDNYPDSYASSPKYTIFQPLLKTSD